MGSDDGCNIIDSQRLWRSLMDLAQISATPKGVCGGLR
jgi:hypothetical protein